MLWTKSKAVLKKLWNENRASVALEAALCLPVFILFIIISILTQYARMADMMWQTALYKTSQEMRLYYIAADQSLSLLDGNQEVREVLQKIPADIQGLILTAGAKKINNEFILQRANYWFKKDVKYSKILPKLIRHVQISSFYNQSEKVIWIKSTIEIPLFFYTYRRHQVVPVSLWIGSGEGIGVDGGEAGEGDNFWSWHNFKRGSYLREEFGGNLPPNYPVIASFSNGEARMIKSIDLTAPTWQNSSALQEEVEGWVRQLEHFNGTKEPWGKEKIHILSSSIQQRSVCIVIPDNSPEERVKQLHELSLQFSLRGISFNIIRHAESHRFQKSSQADP